jgi:pimeloyl-ACP methyl ester carboxylesterase/DNA-binding CsgD family transcriptional regulator
MTDARQQIRFCKTADGVRIAYATSGTGEPLVKTASWFSHLQFDWNNPVWRHWHAELGRSHTYCRYDRRGCGLTRFSLLGMGHGGAVAIAYAARHPERVSHLVIHGSFARGRARRGGTPHQIDVVEMNLKLAELGWGSDDPAFHQFFTAQYMPEATAEQMRLFAELQRMSTLPEFAVRHLHAVFDIDITALAPLVQCPTLILHSRGDLRIPFEEGRLLASLIPGAHFVPLEGRTHFLQENDRAWQQFTAELRAFLPQAGRESPATFQALTAREEEVLEYLSHGLDNAQIAAWLALSEKTVRNHLIGVFAKLGVATRAQAIVRAREAGYPRHPLQTQR